MQSGVLVGGKGRYKKNNKSSIIEACIKNLFKIHHFIVTFKMWKSWIMICKHSVEIFSRNHCQNETMSTIEGTVHFLVTEVIYVVYFIL